MKAIFTILAATVLSAQLALAHVPEDEGHEKTSDRLIDLTSESFE
jgi:hypothetical protein